ncbi:ATP-binding protein [Actinoplanes sp. N902-109]|uniref:ATP-binding protein n=1 Tax=Actinoplanes sp. (strain N902-109) TaxID=649831 RepID=UPI0003294155|nr:ATP-binding protein [Actinoplanes sp. N902-109]AGL14866.1 ATP-binding protein [Actinoplanes sp. N902-109]
MPDASPYLFDSRATDVRVTSDIDGAMIDVVVRGRWDVPLAAALTRTFRQCLAECPDSIVADLRELADPAGESVPTLLHAAASVRLAVCLTPDSPLRTRLPDVFPTVDAARQFLTSRRTPARPIRLSLPPAPESSSAARNLVGEACHQWQLPSLLHPGRAVMSELVGNAIEHARTEMDVSVSRRGGALHLAVRDHDPALPHVRALAPVITGRPLDERGHGLLVVDADAMAWGAMRTAGGKVVWATIRDRGGSPRRW